MGKHVYFVRHAESEENVGHVHRGPQAELTEKGREQARAVAERIERIGVEALISSPFTRAIDTAHAIGERINKTPEQNEIFAEWLPPSQTLGLHRDHPDLQTIFEKIRDSLENPHFRHSDEETFAELVTRAEVALRSLEGHAASRLCVVTHGGFLRILIGVLVFGSAFTKQQFFNMRSHMRTTNTGISYAQFGEEGWRLVTWNDQSHLG